MMIMSRYGISRMERCSCGMFMATADCVVFRSGKRVRGVSGGRSRGGFAVQALKSSELTQDIKHCLIPHLRFNLLEGVTAFADDETDTLVGDAGNGLQNDGEEGVSSNRSIHYWVE